MGGGMRQAGYLAAAGLYALKNNVNRLAIDHERAQRIGAILKKMDWVELIFPIMTNIIIFKIVEKINAATFTAHLNKNNIKASEIGDNSIRFVFHLEQDEEQIQKLEAVILGFDPNKMSTI
jgi:threonine aldolase